jgi:acetyl-CoA carboxylase biotin carboxyl carrier protein
MTRLTVEADVAGNVWKLLVQPGDAVAAEQELLILESMKMEIPAAAPKAGVVRELLVAEGEAVAEGQPLLVIDSA